MGKSSTPFTSESSTQNQALPSNDFNNFIDKHLRKIRWISYGIGAVAIIVVVKKVRMMKRFTDPSQIPDRFIQNANSLQGVVKQVTDDGTLCIEHIPIVDIKIISSILQKLSGKNDHRRLIIKPAGITMTDAGVKWLHDNSVGKHAWFQMFQRDPGILHCDIKIKMSRFKRSSICEELIKQGLCKIEHFEQPPQGDFYNAYLTRLISLEQRASNKDKGLWKEEKPRHWVWNTLATKSSNNWNSLKKVTEKIKSRFKKKER